MFYAAVVILGGSRGREAHGQLQHNILVASAKKSVLSIINGDGKWIELSIDADPI